jgi:rhodanese-related sulfurtransferase
MEACSILSRLFTKLTTNIGVPAVTHEEQQQACKKRTYTIVDVREAYEYANGHIPGPSIIRSRNLIRRKFRGADRSF